MKYRNQDSSHEDYEVMVNFMNLINEEKSKMLHYFYNEEGEHEELSKKWLENMCNKLINITDMFNKVD